MIQFKGNVLFLGAGGGWDIVGAIPLAFRCSNLPVFANYSADSGEFLYKEPSEAFVPEFALSKRLKPLYALGRHGVQLVRKAITQICEKHKIDTIVTIDGGVDSLMRGDEVDAGTILEDSIVMAAIKPLTQKKYHVCVGFGTETEENLNHYRALENMASFKLLEAFALIKDSPEYQEYKHTYETASNESRHSHIHSKIIAAIEGKFGTMEQKIDPRLVISTGTSFANPLMGIYWIYDYDSVVEKNLFVPLFEKTNTFNDAKIVLRQNIGIMNKRSHELLPL